MAATHRNRSKPDDPAFEKTRAKIKTTQLINKLTNHALSRAKRLSMQPSQVTAALGLLKKSLPDLNKTELTDGDGGPLEVILNITKSPKG